MATNILGASSRAMLDALINGEQDVHVMAQLAKTRMRGKIPDLAEALTGNFREHHAFLCRIHLERIDQITASIVQICARIEEAMRPFARALELLQTIPGIGRSNAEVVIAETGADMTRFRTAGHLASWAGTTPGHHESAGRSKSGRTRHGNRWLSATLGTAAMSAARAKDTYLAARYKRLIPRLGKKKALVALQHNILIAVWHMLTTDLPYHDLGGNYFDKLDPDRAKHRAIAQLHRLGYQVQLTPAA